MTTIKTSLHGFYPEEKPYFCSNGFELGIDLAQSHKKATLQILKKRLAEAPEAWEKNVASFLKTTERLSDKGVFTFGKINLIDRYLQTARGYSNGLGIPFQECLLLQAETVPSCQTAIIIDKITQNVSLFHTEENAEDEDLYRMHFIDEFGKDITGLHASRDLLRSLYGYKLVSVVSPIQDQIFFAYPGLCSGGSTMGVNKKTNTFIAVDTLETVVEPAESMLLSNCIAAMAFDIGSVDGVCELFDRLSLAGVHFSSGYAVHVLEFGAKPKLVSFELGGPCIIKMQPTQTEDRLYIAQANYPHSDSLLLMDLFANPKKYKDQYSMSICSDALCMKYRNERLNKIVLRFPLDGKKKQRSKKLITEISSPNGDIEKTEEGFAFTGLPSCCVAGWVVGASEENILELTFGRFAPPKQKSNPFKRWLQPHDNAGKKFAQHNLDEESKRMYSELIHE